MTTHGHGTFDVKVAPIGAYAAADPTLGRMSIDKVLHGDLTGTGQGEMLTAGGGVTGSAAYVAIERITGTLQGRKGSFATYHVGVMTRGAPQLTIALVPDSGTDELTGITGTMTINIVDGKHFYDIDYALPG